MVHAIYLRKAASHPYSCVDFHDIEEMTVYVLSIELTSLQEELGKVERKKPGGSVRMPIHAHVGAGDTQICVCSTCVYQVAFEQYRSYLV